MTTTLRATPNRLRIVLGLLLVASFFFLAPQKAEAATSSSEKQMASLINTARAAAGRSPLKLSGSLSDLARKHSAAMAAKGTIWHNPKLPKWLSPYDWRVAGENVGMGPTMIALHNAFMASPGHRANNLSKSYRKVGVGVVWKSGRAYITVIFMG